MIRTFELHRDQDTTGVTGTGRIAVGVVFEDGTAVTHWLTEVRSTVVWHTVNVGAAREAIERIHGHGGATRVVWIDDAGHDGFPDLGTR